MRTRQWKHSDGLLVHGHFVEGGVVNTNRDSRYRVVKFDKEAGDLFITVRNRRYWFCEFELDEDI